MSFQSAARSFRVALLDRKEPWAIGLAILGGCLVLLLFTQILLQVAQRKAWNSYRGLDAVSAVAVDGSGQVWAAGYQREVPTLILYSKKYRPLEVSMPSELTREAARALMIDSQDRLWLGTEDGLVGMRDVNGQWTLYASNPDNSVSEMVMDGHGKVWVRSHRGPGRIDPEAGDRHYSLMNSGLVNNDAVAITTDAEGQLWVLTRQRELKMLAPDGSWRTHAVVPNTVRNSIFGSILAIDQQGQFWLTIHNGVGVLSPSGTWTEHPLPSSGRPLSMRAILPDAHGRVWVAATLHGLFMYDPKNGWTNYTVRNSGLSGDVNALTLDKQGQLWIGSSRGGLIRFRLEEDVSAQSLSTIRIVRESLVPLAFLGIALLTLWTIALARPGVANGWILVGVAIAFAGWFLLNSLLWGYIRSSVAQSGGMFFIHPLVLLPIPVNVVLLVILYRWRRWMALGAFSAFLVNGIGLILVRPIVEFEPPPVWDAVFMIPFFFPA